MKLTPEQIDEINALLLYNPDTHQDGLKVHSNAAPEMIAAVQRLFEKGMVTQNDGGYLTDLGGKAAEHAQLLNTMLK